MWDAEITIGITGLSENLAGITGLKNSSGPSKKNERRLGRDDEADVDYFPQFR